MLSIILVILIIIFIICITVSLQYIKKNRDNRNNNIFIDNNNNNQTNFPSIPSTPPSPGYMQTNNNQLNVETSRIILTNSFNNNRSAVITNGAQLHQMPGNFKPFFDEPPPPYHTAINLAPCPDISPPPYDELDQLPGAILPSSSIQFNAPSLPRKH